MESIIELSVLHEMNGSYEMFIKVDLLFIYKVGLNDPAGSFRSILKALYAACVFVSEEVNPC